MRTKLQWMDYNRLINNASQAYENAQSEWAKEYWLEVLAKLSQNYQLH